MRSTVNPDGHPCLVQIIGVTVLHRHLLVTFLILYVLVLCLDSVWSLGLFLKADNRPEMEK